MEHLKNLHRKYLEGETTLLEEELLKSKASDMQEGNKLWLSYLNDNRNIFPEKLEEKVSKYIGYKRFRSYSLPRIIAVAATVLIIISAGLLFFPRQKEMTYVDKLAGLTEARMLSTQPTQYQEEEIIYEDESIIIYFK